MKCRQDVEDTLVVDMIEPQGFLPEDRFHTAPFSWGTGNLYSRSFNRKFHSVTFLVENIRFICITNHCTSFRTPVRTPFNTSFNKI